MKGQLGKGEWEWRGCVERGGGEGKGSGDREWGGEVGQRNRERGAGVSSGYRRGRGKGESLEPRVRGVTRPRNAAAFTSGACACFPFSRSPSHPSPSPNRFLNQVMHKRPEGGNYEKI